MQTSRHNSIDGCLDSGSADQSGGSGYTRAHRAGHRQKDQNFCSSQPENMVSRKLTSTSLHGSLQDKRGGFLGHTGLDAISWARMMVLCGWLQNTEADTFRISFNSFVGRRTSNYSYTQIHHQPPSRSSPIRRRCPSPFTR